MSNDVAKVQRTGCRAGLRSRNDLNAAQLHPLKAANNNSVSKATRRGGGEGGQHRGGSSKKNGGKKSGDKGKMTLPYLMQNIDSMPRTEIRKANKDFGVGRHCLKSKKSINSSGFKACGCLGDKACNVQNLKDAIAYWSLSENERALLGPPGSKGTCKLMLFIIPCII